MADLFDGYPLGEVWDEMFGEVGRARPAYAGLFASMQPIDGEELAARADVLSQTYRDAGVTFAHAGEEQPFPLDIVPRVIGAEEWAVIERGVAQRVHALEAFLADVYGAGQVLHRPDRAAQRHHHQRALPPPGARAGAAERRPRARLRHRPGARRGRRLPGARGQPALAVGGQLRHHQPGRDEPGAARAVRRPPHPAGRRLPEQAAGRAEGVRAVRASPTRPSSSSPPASTTPPTSSTRCWPARWASSWSRAAT